MGAFHAKRWNYKQIVPENVSIIGPRNVWIKKGGPVDANNTSGLWTWESPAINWRANGGNFSRAKRLPSRSPGINRNHLPVGQHKTYLTKRTKTLKNNCHEPTYTGRCLSHASPLSPWSFFLVLFSLKICKKQHLIINTTSRKESNQLSIASTKQTKHPCSSANQ